MCVEWVYDGRLGKGAGNGHLCVCGAVMMF